MRPEDSLLAVNQMREGDLSHLQHCAAIAAKPPAQLMGRREKPLSVPLTNYKTNKQPPSSYGLLFQSSQRWLAPTWSAVDRLQHVFVSVSIDNVHSRATSALSARVADPVVGLYGTDVSSSLTVRLFNNSLRQPWRIQSGMYDLQASCY